MPGIDHPTKPLENQMQLPLLPQQIHGQKKQRSGTFIDNMKLPIHRWFRYSAGFSAEWVESILQNRQNGQHEFTIADPFCGSGTTVVAGDWLGVRSVGVEAHPFVARIARTKLNWPCDVSAVLDMANRVRKHAQKPTITESNFPDLIHKCFDEHSLSSLDSLKQAWLLENDGSPASDLVWLAITTILRPSSSAGTAQWQYVLPNKTKKVVAEPYEAFDEQIALMTTDMLVYQRHARAGSCSKARVIQEDARHFPGVASGTVDYVITSPPYANNYDYADATRLEMSFWGEVSSWGDLHEAVRKYLITSSSQHASSEKYDLDELLTLPELAPIHGEIVEVCSKLATERGQHGGKKHYHTMIAAYFVDMAQVWQELRRVCRDDAEVCFVIGDSAPYGVYVPVDRWLGELALGSGFSSFTFEKLRDRNIKWKNRTHTVPLHEGRLWVK